jgi:isocitrate dehydrogenase (NAD+)
MLRHLGEQDAGNRIEAAVAATLIDGRDVTYDVRSEDDDRPAAGTFQVADAIISRV